MYRCAHFVRTSHCTHSLYHICGSRSTLLCAQNDRFISSLSRDVSCSAQNTQHFILVSKGCSHPEFPAVIHENAGMTDVLIQNLSQVVSPTGSSKTRSLLNRRILPALKTIRLPKLRVMSKLCPTTSHSCLLLKILLKALLRFKKQTWATNKFVLCWLHHGTYRSEKRKCGTIASSSL